MLLKIHYIKYNITTNSGRIKYQHLCFMLYIYIKHCKLLYVYLCDCLSFYFKELTFCRIFLIEAIVEDVKRIFSASSRRVKFLLSSSLFLVNLSILYYVYVQCTCTLGCRAYMRKLKTKNWKTASAKKVDKNVGEKNVIFLMYIEGTFLRLLEPTRL